MKDLSKESLVDLVVGLLQGVEEDLCKSHPEITQSLIRELESRGFTCSVVEQAKAMI
jgi:hypothetical protein